MSLIKEGLFAAVALIGMSHLAAGQEPATIVVGDVSLTAADGLVFPAAGVRVTLTCGTDRAPVIEISDERGEFRFANVSVDTCSLLADLQGFKSASAAAVATRDREVAHVRLHLDVEPVYAGLTVTAELPSEFRSESCECHRSIASRRPAGVAKGTGERCVRP
jgi:hypothetical protein